MKSALWGNVLALPRGFTIKFMFIETVRELIKAVSEVVFYVEIYMNVEPQNGYFSKCGYFCGQLIKHPPNGTQIK